MKDAAEYFDAQYHTKEPVPSGVDVPIAPQDGVVAPLRPDDVTLSLIHI